MSGLGYQTSWVDTQTAEGAVARKRLVVHGTSAGQVKQAVDGSAPIIGVAFQIDYVDGGVCEIARDQAPEVEYGAAVSRGDRLTADAQGRAIPAAAGQFYFGYAEKDGGVGDVGGVFVAPGQVEAA